MSKAITFPPGRLVWGSVYVGQTKDYDGNPYTNKDGTPSQRFSFGYAIPKGNEGHWANTEWGKEIWAIGHTCPGGAAQRNDFSWKITDGDSTLSKKGSNTPINQKQGYAGHWVLSFSSSFAPSLFVLENGKPVQLLQEDYIKAGHYVQVYGTITLNDNMKNPGVFLNHNYVCHVGFGPEIKTGPDVNEVGFGAMPLPPGASAAPIGGFAPAMPAVPGVPAATPAMPAIPSAPAVAVPLPSPVPVAAPAPAPVPAARQLVAVPGAQYTIEACRAAGWTDDQIVQNGVATWSSAAPAPAPGVQPVPSFLNGPPQA